MNRKSARVIVIHENKLLVMFRNKFGTKYATLIGGKIELGETAVQAAEREVKEEASINIANPKLVFLEHADFYGDQYIFYCDYVSGDPKLSLDSPELAINKLGKNLYEPGWLDLEDLPGVPFLSAELQSAIIDACANGWSNDVQEFTSKRNV